MGEIHPTHPACAKPNYMGTTLSHHGDKWSHLVCPPSNSQYWVQPPFWYPRPSRETQALAGSGSITSSVGLPCPSLRNRCRALWDQREGMSFGFHFQLFVICPNCTVKIWNLKIQNLEIAQSTTSSARAYLIDGASLAHTTFTTNSRKMIFIPVWFCLFCFFLFGNRCLSQTSLELMMGPTFWVSGTTAYLPISQKGTWSLEQFRCSPRLTEQATGPTFQSREMGIEQQYLLTWAGWLHSHKSMNKGGDLKLPFKWPSYVQRHRCLTSTALLTWASGSEGSPLPVTQIPDTCPRLWEWATRSPLQAGLTPASYSGSVPFVSPHLLCTQGSSIRTLHVIAI